MSFKISQPNSTHNSQERSTTPQKRCVQQQMTPISINKTADQSVDIYDRLFNTSPEAKAYQYSEVDRWKEEARFWKQKAYEIKNNQQKFQNEQLLHEMKQVSGILKKHDTYDQDYKPRQSENSYDNEQKAEKLKKQLADNQLVLKHYHEQQLEEIFYLKEQIAKLQKEKAYSNQNTELIFKIQQMQQIESDNSNLYNQLKVLQDQNHQLKTQLANQQPTHQLSPVASQTKIDELIETNNQLRSTIEKLDQEIRYLNTINIDLQKQKKEYENQAKSSNSTRLKKENEDLKEQIEMLNVRLEAMFDQSLEQKNVKYYNKVLSYQQSTKQEWDQMMTDNLNLQKMLLEIQKENEELNKKLKQLQKQQPNEDQMNQLSQLQVQLKKVTNELNKLQLHNEQLQQEKNELEYDKNQLELQMQSQIQNQKSSSRQESPQKNAMLEVWIAKYQKLEKQKEIELKLKDEHFGEISNSFQISLQQQKDFYESQINTLKNITDGKIRENEELRQINQNLQANLNQQIVTFFKFIIFKFNQQKLALEFEQYKNNPPYQSHRELQNQVNDLTQQLINLQSLLQMKYVECEQLRRYKQ